MDPTCDLRGASLAVAPRDVPDPARDLDPSSPHAGRAVLAGGCFWCVEAVFRELDGVTGVVSGYAGGTAASADYRSVCSGTTDHAEVVELRFDPARLSFGQVLKLFFAVAHDPTQLDAQGNDRGRQYRSAIFWLDEAQREVAEAYIRQLEAAKVFVRPIVTRLEPLRELFPAEAYHQDYAARNPEQPYIAAVSAPKVAKLRKEFAGRLAARRR